MSEPVGEWLHWWPIIDDDMPFRALVNEATPILQAKIAQKDLELTDRVRWSVASGKSIAGAGAYELILVARCPVSRRGE